MSLPYRGLVDVMLISADGSEHVERFPAILNEAKPGLFELSTPRRFRKTCCEPWSTSTR
jgi:hypothetical protein